MRERTGGAVIRRDKRGNESVEPVLYSTEVEALAVKEVNNRLLGRWGSTYRIAPARLVVLEHD